MQPSGFENISGSDLGLTVVRNGKSTAGHQRILKRQ